MVGVFLAIYIKEELVPYMSNLSADLVPCGTPNAQWLIYLIIAGVMGKIGNKGAVAIRFSLYGTGFCFVCSHLAAGSSHEAVERRNQDVKNITTKLHFSQGTTYHHNNSWSHISILGQNIFDHENLFWFGDLNYRLDLGRGLVLSLIESQSWAGIAATTDKAMLTTFV